jgi:Tfp pilus assembly protein PilV
VITVWHTFWEGNEECAVWLEKLMGDELNYYVIEETNVTRELEKSTIEWATLYLFQSLYPNPETRAMALSNKFRERTASTERTWRKQGLTEVSEAGRANPDHPATKRSQPRTHPARSTNITAGSQRGANNPGLGATAQATLLNEQLRALRAQLTIAIFT